MLIYFGCSIIFFYLFINFPLIVFNNACRAFAYLRKKKLVAIAKIQV